jgi:hypothetical protein
MVKRHLPSARPAATTVRNSGPYAASGSSALKPLASFRFLRFVQRGLLVALVLVCVFDPADLFLHVKVPIFIAICAIFIVELMLAGERRTFPISLALYVGLFSVLLPLASLSIYALRDNTFETFAGWHYIKASLFFWIAIVLYGTNINFVGIISRVLTCLSCFIACVGTLMMASPLSIVPLVVLGTKYDNMDFGHRIYGGMHFPTVFYKTSPLIVIAICYYAFLFVRSHRISSALALTINVLGMFLSGTRANILISLAAPLFVFCWYARRKILTLTITSVVLIGVVGASMAVLKDMFSTGEVSNQVKIGYLSDYARVLGEPLNMLLGQGLGASFMCFTLQENITVTELSFLEVFRFYGVFLGIFFVGLLLYPIFMLLRDRRPENGFMLIGYVLYLLIATTNPLLFSSSGMIVLSCVVYSAYRYTRTPASSTYQVGSSLGPAGLAVSGLSG